MFERGKIAERLWAQAVMCEEAAHLYCDDVIALPLEGLAQYCREVAYLVLREEPAAKKH